MKFESWWRRSEYLNAFCFTLIRNTWLGVESYTSQLSKLVRCFVYMMRAIIESQHHKLMHFPHMFSYREKEWRVEGVGVGGEVKETQVEWEKDRWPEKHECMAERWMAGK